MNKKEYITKLGIFLSDNNMTMSMSELAKHLNRNGITTNSGNEFKGKRGTFTLVDNLVDEIVASGNQPDANKISGAFPKDDGTFAFD